MKIKRGEKIIHQSAVTLFTGLMISWLLVYCEGGKRGNVGIPGGEFLGAYEAVVSLADRRVEIKSANLNSDIVAGENLVAGGFPFSIWGTLYYNAATKDAAIDFTVTNKHTEIALQRVDLRIRAITDPAIVIDGDTPSGDAGSIVPGGFKLVGTVPCCNGAKNITSWQFHNVTADFRFWFDVYGDRAITIHTIAGNGSGTISGDGGPAKEAGTPAPHSIAVDRSGHFAYVFGIGSPFVPPKIRLIDLNGIINTIAGDGTQIYNGENIPAISQGFCDIYGLAVDNNGDIYVADLGFSIVQKIDIQTGLISTVAGIPPPVGSDCTNPNTGYNGDGIPATSAKLYFPSDVAFDNEGNLLIADGVNGRIRKVDKNTGIITTIAGVGNCNSCDNNPDPLNSCIITTDIDVSSNGDIYYYDTRCGKVKKISNGIISTVVGNGRKLVCGIDYNRVRTCQDGLPATDVPLDTPRGIMIHPDGSVYVTDKVCNIICRRDPAGVASVVAGRTNPLDPQGCYSGDTYPARDEACLNEPEKIDYLDPKHIIFADYENNRIRMLSLP